MMKTVLLCPDKFKGSLSAEEVSRCLANGIKSADASIDCLLHPLADGGDGSLSVIINKLDVKRIDLEVTDPLGRPVGAYYYINDDAAFIELAVASGHHLLHSEERNPLHTSTAGTGELMRDALIKGFRQIYLFLGGSSTNDAGIGIAHALGFRFLDDNGQALSPVGRNLGSISRIVPPRHFYSDVTINVMYDVNNPMHGKNGAAWCFARQKGASEQDVVILDQGLEHIGSVFEAYSGRKVSDLPGSGAAGAIGAGMVALFGANMNPGFNMLASLTKLEERIRESDVVISGEGKVDRSSLEGKVVGGVAAICKKYKKTLWVVSGMSELSEDDISTAGIMKIMTINELAQNHNDAIHNACHYLESIGLKAGSLLLHDSE